MKGTRTSYFAPADLYTIKWDVTASMLDDDPHVALPPEDAHSNFFAVAM